MVSMSKDIIAGIDQRIERIKAELAKLELALKALTKKKR